MKSTITQSRGSVLNDAGRSGRTYQGRLILLLALLCSFSSIPAFSQTYCTTGLYSSGCSFGDYINSFSTSGGSTNITNNNSGCASGALGYSNYTTMVHTGVQGTTVNWSYTNCPTWTEVYVIYVDWNQNGILNDPGEVMFAQAASAGTTGGATVTGSFTIPLTANPGTTRMRIRCAYYPSATPTPCSTEIDGETEDYSIAVVAAVPCSGSPTPGTAVANPTSVCPGSSTTLSLTGASLSSGITYQWQVLVGATWTNIAGATSPAYTTPAITATTQYRCELTCSNSTNAPVQSTPVTVTIASFPLPYIQTFESITANNQLPQCMSATSLSTYTYTYTAPTSSYNQTNHTPGGSKFASYRYGANDWFFTPGLSFTAGTTYQVSFWYITDGYSGWLSLQAAYGTSPTAAAMTNIVGTPVTNATNTTYQQYVGTFTPTTSGTFNVGIGVNSNFVPWYLTIDDINVVALPPCSGAPVAGSITPSATITGCPGSTYSFTTTGTTTAANLTYQWVQQTNSNPAWVPVTGGIGNTSTFFTTPPISDTIRYRMVVKCNNSNLTDTTAAVTINVPRVAYAAIPYTQDFESWVNRCGTTDVPSLNWTNNPATGNNSWRRYDQGASAAWTSPTSGTWTPTAAVGTYCARWHEYYATPPGSAGSLSMYVDCSAFTGAKELQFYKRTDAGTTYPADSLKVYLSTDGGNTFSLLGAFGPGTGGWDYHTIPFNSNTATTVIRFDAKADYNYYTDIGLDYVRVLPPCSGKPVAGTITPVVPCANTNFTLSTTGTSQVAGLVYQWQQLVGTTWTNVLPGNTSIITQNINATTTYRAIVNCANSNQADTTAPYTVTLGSFYFCYCASAPNPSYGIYSDIGNVTMKTQPANTVLLNNGIATPLINNPAATGFYTDFRSSVPPTPVYRDSLYRLSVTQISQNTFLVSTVAAFADFNRDGIFQSPAERILYKVTAAATQEVNDTFRVPSAAGIGLTGMRVIIEYGTNVAINPCGIYTTYGETEDYLLDIKYPPCNGPANAGTAYITDTATCPGYTVDLGDTTYEKQRSALIRTWQSTINNGASWNTIANSTNKDTLNNQLISVPVRYRVRMICPVTGDTTYSNVVSVNIKLPYQCYPYSQAGGGGGSNDTSDVGSFQIGNFVMNTGGPHLRNPQAFRKRTDNTSIPGIILYADSTYRLAIYHIMRGDTHADARVSVFMDYNNNLQYDATGQSFPFPSELVYTGVTTAANWYLDTTIKIPSTVIPNVLTGLRVILNNDVNPTSPANLGIGGYVSGETEDYVVMFRRGNAAGITNTGNLRDLVVYPNPTEGRFTVMVNSLKAVSNVDVTVTTLTGQKVMTRSFTNSGAQFTANLDLSSQAKGIYFIEVRADGEKVVSKLVIR